MMQTANRSLHVSLQRSVLGFFVTKKPICCKIIDSVLYSVGFIFKIPYQKYTKIYTKIYQIQGNITNQQSNCKILKWQCYLVHKDYMMIDKKHFHLFTLLFLSYCWWCWTISNNTKCRY